MITGVHAMIFSKDEAADRIFLRDVIGLDCIDSGGGWLIFKLPPGEVAVHPTDGAQSQELYLMCDDINATVDHLAANGVTCAEVTDQGWGLLTSIRLPGGSDLGLYEPRHPRATEL